MNEEEAKAIEELKNCCLFWEGQYISSDKEEDRKMAEKEIAINRTLLNLIEKQKAEIEDKQDEINVLEAQKESIENQFEQAKIEIEKKDEESHFIQSELDITNAKIIELNKIIDEMADYIGKIDDETIDIDNIQEIEAKLNRSTISILKEEIETINKLVQAVKQLDKKIREE